MRYMLVNRELRQIVQEFETREEASARLADIEREDPALADTLRIEHVGPEPSQGEKGQ